MSNPTLYRLVDSWVTYKRDNEDGTITYEGELMPVEPIITVKVGDVWDDELWLPHLVERGTVIAVVRIGTWDYDPEWRKA